MAKETVTVRVEASLRERLDEIAESMQRDRSFVITEALESYVELQDWQLQRIRQGLKEANAGEFVPQAEVEQILARLTKK